jgi:cytochrome P450
MADLPRLRYLRTVVDEALRLYPPTFMLSRRAVAADELCGYEVAPGATVMLSPYITHRLAAFWDNPEAFDPDRFTPERAAGRHKYAYIPFITGPRQCIGNSFALAEIQLALATLLQRYRLTPIPGYPVSASARALLKPGPQVWMRVTPA